MHGRCWPQWTRFRQALAIGAALIGVGLSAHAANPAAAELAKPELVVEGSRDGGRFNSPRGIALNPTTGEIIVANTSDHRIEVYSLDGRLLVRFEHRVRAEDGTLIEGLPRSVAVAGTSRMLVADSYAPYVDVLDYRGRSVAELKTPVPQGAGGISAVAVTRNGTILAAGPGEKGRIYVFAPDFTPIGSWGEPGSDLGHLSGIVAMAELPDGAIAVVCSQTEVAVQIFSPEGRYLRGFGRHDYGPGNFSLPSGLAVTPPQGLPC